MLAAPVIEEGGDGAHMDGGAGADAMAAVLRAQQQQQVSPTPHRVRHQQLHLLRGRLRCHVHYRLTRMARTHHRQLIRPIRIHQARVPERRRPATLLLRRASQYRPLVCRLQAGRPLLHRAGHLRCLAGLAFLQQPPIHCQRRALQALQALSGQGGHQANRQLLWLCCLQQVLLHLWHTHALWPRHLCKLHNRLPREWRRQLARL